jgi:hypothetical protein
LLGILPWLRLLLLLSQHGLRLRLLCCLLAGSATPLPALSGHGRTLLWVGGFGSEVATALCGRRGGHSLGGCGSPSLLALLRAASLLALRRRLLLLLLRLLVSLCLLLLLRLLANLCLLLLRLLASLCLQLPIGQLTEAKGLATQLLQALLVALRARGAHVSVAAALALAAAPAISMAAAGAVWHGAPLVRAAPLRDVGSAGRCVAPVLRAIQGLRAHLRGLPVDRLARPRGYLRGLRCLGRRLGLTGLPHPSGLLSSGLRCLRDLWCLGRRLDRSGLPRRPSLSRLRCLRYRLLRGSNLRCPCCLCGLRSLRLRGLRNLRLRGLLPLRSQAAQLLLLALAQGRLRRCSILLRLLLRVLLLLGLQRGVLPLHIQGRTARRTDTTTTNTSAYTSQAHGRLRAPCGGTCMAPAWAFTCCPGGSNICRCTGAAEPIAPAALLWSTSASRMMSAIRAF